MQRRLVRDPQRREEKKVKNTIPLSKTTKEVITIELPTILPLHVIPSTHLITSLFTQYYLTKCTYWAPHHCIPLPTSQLFSTLGLGWEISSSSQMINISCPVLTVTCHPIHHITMRKGAPSQSVRTLYCNEWGTTLHSKYAEQTTYSSNRVEFARGVCGWQQRGNVYVIPHGHPL